MDITYTRALSAILLALVACGDAQHPEPMPDHEPLTGSVTWWECDDDAHLTLTVELGGMSDVTCAPCAGAPTAIDGGWSGSVMCGLVDPATTILTCETSSGDMVWMPVAQVPGDSAKCLGHVASPSGK